MLSFLDFARMLAGQASSATNIYKIREVRRPNVRLSGCKSRRKPFVKRFSGSGGGERGGKGGREGRFSRGASGYKSMLEGTSSDLIGKKR